MPLLPAGTEVLAGLELGGVPIATALSLRTGLPAAFVRKEAKAYGTARLAEGADIAGRRVTVIEDVITTGGQVVISTNELRALGAIVDHVVCVIDRSPDHGAALAAEGLTMISLLTRADLDAAEAHDGLKPPDCQATRAPARKLGEQRVADPAAGEVQRAADAHDALRLVDRLAAHAERGLDAVLLGRAAPSACGCGARRTARR